MLTRRNLLKSAAVGLGALAVAPVLFSPDSATAATSSGGKKVLTVFYSRSGNTRDIARKIHTIAGGDIVELETVNPYPAEYRATTEQAKRELETNFRPPLQVTVDDISPYDFIFVGSPSWWGTFAAPVRGFLMGHDFSGKTLIPFITHEGSGLGKSVADMKTLCPQAVILDGLAVRGSRVANAQEEVSQWLTRIGVSR